MVGGALVVPNVAQLGDKALNFLDRRGRRLETKRALAYMSRRRLIDYQEMSDGSLHIRITNTGRLREKQVRFDELKISKMSKWDKKWRLVMFDVPESRKRSRRALSLKLKQLNFYQLQKSVWVQAYPCYTEIELVKQVFGIPDKDIVFAETSRIERDPAILEHFKLTS